MFFEPQLMGKEPMLRIPEGSSSKDLRLGQSVAHLELKEFRDEMWKKARNLDPWELLPQSFKKLIEETQPKRVGFFVPKLEWAEAKNLLSFAQQISATPLLLRLQGDEMSFHTYDPQASLETKNGTQHIVSDSPERVPDLLLVPALACDSKGNRIGRGKGYYDRFIAKHPQVLRCAVIHSNFLFDELPSQFFHKADQKVHFVLTEKDFIKISNGNEVPL